LFFSLLASKKVPIPQKNEVFSLDDRGKTEGNITCSKQCFTIIFWNRFATFFWPGPASFSGRWQKPAIPEKIQWTARPAGVSQEHPQKKFFAG